jgi:hypothetical protein
MKSLTIKEVLITIAISYFVISYVNNNINPFELSIETRVCQLVITGVSLFIQIAIKNLTQQ